MFMILRDESFSMNGTKKKKGSKRKLPDDNVVSMMGSKFRSRTGCLICRKRKRKCDETHPDCNYCSTRGLQCVYSKEKETNKDEKSVILSTSKSPDLELPISPFPVVEQQEAFQQFSSSSNQNYTDKTPQRANGFQALIAMDMALRTMDMALKAREHNMAYHRGLNKLNNKENKYDDKRIYEVNFNDKDSNETNYDNEDIEDNGSMDLQTYDNDFKFNTTNNSDGNDINSLIKLEDITVLPEQLQIAASNDNTTTSTFPFTINPSSIPCLYLDDNGLNYLDFYNNKVARILAIGQDSMNYFTKFYSSLAYNEESFLYAITSWGALYSGEDIEIKTYMNKAIKKFNQNFNHKNSTDVYFKICFNSILYGYYACLGDTVLWKKLHDESCQIIRDNGGLHKFSKRFNFTNEIRFILSNVQYIDVTSSYNHKYGSLFPMEDYEELFDSEEFKRTELDYGIDTLQGVQQSLYITIGMLMNTKVKINQTLIKLNDCKDSDEYFTSRQELWQLMNTRVNELSEKLTNCQPKYNLLNLIKANSADYELYLIAFDLYKIIANIYLNLYLKKIGPKSLEIQQLMHQALPLMEDLIHTKFCVILCIPLLMVGHCCFNKFDKELIEKILGQVNRLSPVLNIDKTWKVIKKAWEMNPNGNLIVDWADTFESFGWTLNLC